MADRPGYRPAAKPKTALRARKPAPVGSGMFSVTGPAARRLGDPSQTTTPTAPLPFSGSGNGSSTTGSVVTSQRLWYYKLTRFNPIRQLKPETLSHWLDLFQQGYLRYFALLADAVEHRDPTLMTVVPKRKAAAKRCEWQIVVQEDLDPGEMAAAEEQKEALYQFYNRARATDAVDLNVVGGMPLLLDQMMQCVGHKYAVHEIVWMPQDDGELSARFNYIPVWFFENRTGRLRFLTMDYSVGGVALRDGSFMVTVGPGLMEPSVVAYMFKNLTLRDFLMYCEKCAMPGVIGRTDAPYGSDNYKAFADALRAVATDFTAAFNKSDEVDTVDFGKSGQLPYDKLVDYMDRALASLWRGADLSTISGKTTQGGQGALLQGKEEYYLQLDDAQRLTESLNANVDPLVLQWRFGKGVKALAHVKVVVPPNIEVATEVAKINAMLGWGARDIGVKQMHEALGVGTMMRGDTPLTPPPTGPGAAAGGAMQNPARQYEASLDAADEARLDEMYALAANARHEREAGLRALMAAASEDMARETAAALRPLRDAVNEALSAQDGAVLPAVRELRRRTPSILLKINEDPGNARALADAMSSAWFKGLYAARER